MSLILSGDATIYYEEYGSGDPLVLLPGLLGTIETDWRRFISGFSDQFHTIAVDLRGHGRTNNPSGSLRLQLFVDDLHTLLDTLQIEKAYICGYSLGGYIGLAFGLEHAGSVRGLVMHGTRFFWSPEAALETQARMDPDSISIKLPQWETLRREHSPGAGVEGWKDLLASGREFIGSIVDEGISLRALARARFPILVSVGDADDMVPHAEAEQLANSLPNASLLVLENTRHPIQTVSTSRFVTAVTSFFQSANAR